mmetsp:Transcript_98472/g.306354  ORF Transcript_98472/g.306354 Transcript_98472/m.306354 type:complete len:217 (-) Transcript_98472:337-987(-)
MAPMAPMAPMLAIMAAMPGMPPIMAAMPGIPAMPGMPMQPPMPSKPSCSLPGPGLSFLASCISSRGGGGSWPRNGGAWSCSMRSAFVRVAQRANHAWSENSWTQPTALAMAFSSEIGTPLMFTARSPPGPKPMATPSTWMWQPVRSCRSLTLAPLTPMRALTDFEGITTAKRRSSSCPGMMHSVQFETMESTCRRAARMPSQLLACSVTTCWSVPG